MKEFTTYQAIWIKAWIGGWIEGWKEGILAEAKRMLLLVGENRFGPPDARIIAALQKIEDVARLEEMCVRVLNTEGWSEVFNEPRRRNGWRQSRP